MEYPERVPIVVPGAVGTLRPIVLQQWLAEVGSEVYEGERLAELSVPGVLVCVSSPCRGRLDKILATPLMAVEATTILGWIECRDDEG